MRNRFPSSQLSGRNLKLLSFIKVGRNSSVGKTSRYGLEGPGIESLWGRHFSHPSRPALEPTEPPLQWIPGFSPGVKAAGTWR
jgi:hypothetical protein